MTTDSRPACRTRGAFPMPAGARRFAGAEDGMMSFTVVVAVLAFLVLAGVVANVAATIRHKIEVQNGADALARSLALHRARGLNAVTAANHMIGELLALVVLHHAIGGDELDGRPRPLGGNELGQRPPLAAAYLLARGLAYDHRFDDPLYKQVYRGPAPEEGATLRYSRLRLQQVLTWTYQAFAIGGALKLASDIPIPFLSQALLVSGTAAEAFGSVFEVWVKFEWLELDALHRLADALGPPKRIIESTLIPLLHLYEQDVSYSTLARAAGVVDAVAAANHVEGQAWPILFTPRLPVAPEPRIDELPAAAVGRSQLIRAAYPWVVYWRKPIRDLMGAALRLSLAEVHFRKFSNEFTRTRALDLQTHKNVYLYVLEGVDLKLRDKGYEDWTEAAHSGVTDRLFADLAFAYRPPPGVVSPAIFPQPNPGGISAYAQALTYNANPQAPGPPGPSQPIVGWDTLNWGAPAPEYPIPGHDDPGRCPVVKLNWQAKLVPVRAPMLAEGVALTPGLKNRDVLTRTLPYALAPTLRNH